MIYGFSALGYEGVLVSVEVDMTNSIPGLDIVGLASSEVKEAKERVRIAIKSSGFIWPHKRLMVNLSPADIKKRGAGFDLPIALAILIATKQLDMQIENILALGELQFNGTIRPVRHCLIAASTAANFGIKEFLVPQDNVDEVRVIPDTKGCAISHLKELHSSLDYPPCLSSFPYTSNVDENTFINTTHSPENEFFINEESSSTIDDNIFANSLSDLSYCDDLKRVIQIVATGRHNLYLSGPPGTGKTALATRLGNLLPSLTFEESLELSKIYSCCNDTNTKNLFHHKANVQRNILIDKRPTRMPHHTASVEGMIGSATNFIPGEISLAHSGVLILDEAPEFKMRVLQALREPMDNQQVHISRADNKWVCPADFQLILTSNLCPCGNLGKSENTNQWCLCSELEIFKYWKRIGGAIWDRIDVKVQTKSIELQEEESYSERKEKYLKMRRAVFSAIDIQKNRAKKSAKIWNARYTSQEVEQYFNIDSNAKKEILNFSKEHGISERGKLMISRLGRTIADLESENMVKQHHIEEASVLTGNINISDKTSVFDTIQGFRVKSE